MKSELYTDNPYQYLVDEIYLAGKMNAYKAMVEYLREELKTQLLYVAYQKRLKRESKRNINARSIGGD